jgi:hypothetical protein
LFDERLNQILTKYHIEKIDEKNLNDNLDLTVKGILTDYCAGKKCALWGAGRMNITSSHSAILIGKYATYLQNLICVIDSDPDFQGKTFLGYPIIAPDQISEYDLDVIVISSKNSGRSIVESLLKVSPESKYVDIYGELRSRGIEVYNNFYDENSIYTQIFDYKEKLEQETSGTKREVLLQKLIGLYYSIRDFYYADHYIDLYINEKYSCSERFTELRNEIHQLLQDMKDINRKKTEDISLFYIDALRQKDVYDPGTGNLRILRKYFECAKVYTNAYSTGATTYESMVSAILGRYPLDCNVYSRNFLRNLDESELLRTVYEEGYDIHWMVSDCYRLLEEDSRIKFDIQIYMTKKLWNLSCSLAEARNKSFHFIYFPYEIHCPMLCGYHSIKPVIRGFSNMGIEDFPESIETQYKECIDYMDKQFDFYYDLLGEHTTKVIFSDHSQVVYDKNNIDKTYNMYYKDKELCTHIPLLLSKKPLTYQVYDSYISMVDFNQIMLNLMKGNDLKDLEREIIRYQYYPIHSAKIRFHAISCGYEDYIEGMDIFVSKNYIYVKTGTGKEEVYKHNDLLSNIIQLDEGQDFKNKVISSYHIAF